MFAGAEEFYPVLIGDVRAIFGTSDIDDKHREMIILRAASILDVPYEWTRTPLETTDKIGSRTSPLG